MMAMIDNDLEDTSESDSDEGGDSDGDGDGDGGGDGDGSHAPLSPAAAPPAPDFAAVARRLGAAKEALIEGYRRTRAQVRGVGTGVGEGAAQGEGRGYWCACVHTCS